MTARRLSGVVLFAVVATRSALRASSAQPAGARGAIGPAAKGALPGLGDLARIPRVRWSAEAAIARIGGAQR